MAGKSYQKAKSTGRSRSGVKRNVTHASHATNRPTCPVKPFKKPTYQLRAFGALATLEVQHGLEPFPEDEVLMQVCEDAEDNAESLGPRMTACVLSEIDMMHNTGYIVKDDDTAEIRLTTDTQKILLDIGSDLAQQTFTTSLEKHRMFCGHIRQRVGPRQTMTKPQLMRRNRLLERHHAGCLLLPNGMTPDDEALTQEPIPGPSSFAGPLTDAAAALDAMSAKDQMHVDTPPVRLSASRSWNHPAAAYPTPESVPRRPSHPQPTQLPPSPSPGNHAAVLSDSDDEMDIDESPSHTSLQVQFEAARHEIDERQADGSHSVLPGSIQDRPFCQKRVKWRQRYMVLEEEHLQLQKRNGELLSQIDQAKHDIVELEKRHQSEGRANERLMAELQRCHDEVDECKVRIEDLEQAEVALCVHWDADSTQLRETVAELEAAVEAQKLKIHADLKRVQLLAAAMAENYD